mgnify:CR=1 FL=1
MGETISLVNTIDIATYKSFVRLIVTRLNEDNHHDSNYRNALLKQDWSSSFEAFLIRVRGMYLVAKPNNEDHVSCLADSHLAEMVSSEFLQVPGSLYREKAIYNDWILVALAVSHF